MRSVANYLSNDKVSVQISESPGDARYLIARFTIPTARQVDVVDSIGRSFHEVDNVSNLSIHFPRKRRRSPRRRSPRKIASATLLAKALDREDYLEAEKYLAVDCYYEFREETIEGKDSIINAYRENGEAGKRRFDAIVYESSVVPLGSNKARIDYVDFLTLSGDRHVHRCAQEVCIGDDGLITSIKHIDLDGERESLRKFVKSHP